MAPDVYMCKECGANLNLRSVDLFPADIYFAAGDRDTVSLGRVDPSKIRFEEEDKIRPFYETLSYWGIQRNRTKIRCQSCGRLLGHVYNDGPPLMDRYGQLGGIIGPSQVIPRLSRYRFKCKSLLVSSEETS